MLQGAASFCLGSLGEKAAAAQLLQPQAQLLCSALKASSQIQLSCALGFRHHNFLLFFANLQASVSCALSPAWNPFSLSHSSDVTSSGSLHDAHAHARMPVPTHTHIPHGRVRLHPEHLEHLINTSAISHSYCFVMTCCAFLQFYTVNVLKSWTISYLSLYPSS